MIILLALLILLIFIFIHSYNYRKEMKRLNDNKKILELLESKYRDLAVSIKDEYLSTVDYNNITEEDLYCDIREVIKDRLCNVALFAEKRDIVDKIEDETVYEFIDSIVCDIDFTKLFDINKSLDTDKEKKTINELAIEAVSNDIKSDSSTTDITNELNNIFFNDL